MGRFCSLLICTFLLSQLVIAQEQNLSGVELSIDQDRLADALRTEPYEADNYAISLRLGIYGELANSTYLGLPWVREKVDGFLIDKILYNRGFEKESTSHNFTFTVNGFSPAFISDRSQTFQDTLGSGYRLSQDRPFSSFTGFRSTRRVEGGKRFVHSAFYQDMAINTSFTFGLASIGWTKGLDDLIGAERPEAVLWSKSDTVRYPINYPTGQVIPRPLPVFMYSLSAEMVVLKPLRKLVVQLRPELNLGYYTNVGLGVDIGKVMNVEKLVDKLGYTDTHNPSVLKVNNDNIGLALTGSFTARAVLYNAHLNALYGAGSNHYITLADTRKIMLESNVGLKLQLLKKIEFSMSFNWRTSEIKLDNAKSHLWGTIGLKYLIAPEGEGCYDSY